MKLAKDKPETPAPIIKYLTEVEIVLFLVIDGRSLKSKGADMNDLVNILLRYHAYNAANLDGGNSSVMVIDNKIINHPFNWDNREETRPIASGFVVVEQEKL